MTQDLSSRGLSRRNLLIGIGASATAALAGCVSEPRARIVGMSAFAPDVPSYYRDIYGPMTDGGFNIPPIDLGRVDPKFLRREVAYGGGEAPGTVIVDTQNRFAYLVQPGGTAMRYGVGIGKEGFAWGGRAKVQFKRAWPTWTPPAEMIERRPDLLPYADGMEPGLANPLGARALYLFQDGRDTLYRLHGTPEWWTIGTAMSSGCVRFMNQDIIDLYNRAESGATVIVNQGGGGIV